MPYSRYVEVGRVALVNYGPEYGKLVVITDVVDQNRALVDRPDETRRMINFKRLALTDYKIAIPRSCKKKVLKEALEKSDVFAKFASSSWGKKLAKQQSKASQTDFDRYVALRERIVKSLKIRQKVNALKREAKKKN